MAKKTSKPELISLAELARRANITRAAVSAWIRNRESEGLHLTHASGRRSKLVDVNHPTVKRYIENPTTGSGRPRGASGPERKSPASTRKLRAQIARLRLQTAALRGRYLSRDAAFLILDKMHNLEAEYFAGFPARVLTHIEKERITISQKARKQVKELIDEALAGAHESTSRIISDFKKQVEHEKTT